MKTGVTKIIVIVFVVFACYLVVRCKDNSSPSKGNNDPIVHKVSDISNAKQLYSEGMEILNDRIFIQSSDKEKAMELNKKAIEKFSAAYKSDTSLIDPVLFASECTMFAKDYQSCIYWTSKLMKLDTTQRNRQFCIGRVAYCNGQLKSRQ